MQICPYGDTANDGLVQLSFTLPLPPGARAREKEIIFSPGDQKESV